ncbi:MAG: hypothetical protein HKN06_03595 [Gammaproteobacteria bacterium]|nr:hypothetical protein [Gammaproteobacteria bacterium]
MVRNFTINELALGFLAVSAATLAGLAAAGVPAAQTVALLFGALGIFALTVWRTEIGLALLIFAIYVNLSAVLIEYHGVASVAKGYLPYIVVLLFADWVRSGHRPYLPGKAMLVLTVYLIALTLSFYYAQDSNRVSDGLTELLKSLALALGIAMLIWRPDRLRIALWSILGGAIFLGGLSTVKFLSGNFTPEYGGFAQSSISFMLGEQKIFRMSGPLYDPNYFGQLLLIAMPIAVERMINEKFIGLQIAAGAALLLGLASVILTFSRGAFVAVLVVAGIAILASRSRRRLMALSALAVLVSLPLLPTGYLDRFASALPALSQERADVSVRGRASEMLVAWEMFRDHPLLGVGYQNYPEYFQRYTIEFDQMPRGQARPAHSLYLEIAAERGLLGLCTFAALLLYFGRVVVEALRHPDRVGGEDAADMVAGLAMGFIAYLVAAVFLHDAYPRYFWLMTGLILAVSGMLSQQAGQAAALADRNHPGIVPPEPVS